MKLRSSLLEVDDFSYILAGDNVITTTIDDPAPALAINGGGMADIRGTIQENGGSYEITISTDPPLQAALPVRVSTSGSGDSEDYVLFSSTAGITLTNTGGIAQFGTCLWF